MARNKRTPTSFEHLNLAVQQMINGKTDREIAILGGAVLEGMLYDLLSQNLVDSPYQRCNQLFEYPKPLGSFGNMLSMAFAFGVISEEEYCFTNIVKKIRNHAAHSMGLDGEDFSFSRDPVRAMIFEFYPKFAIQQVPKEMKEKILGDFNRMMDTDSCLAYRMVFCSAAVRLLSRQLVTKPLNPQPEINEGLTDEGDNQQGEQAAP